MNKLDIKAIRKSSLNLTFKKGFLNWRDLAIICFIFSFLGVSYAFSTSFISMVDKHFNDLYFNNKTFEKAEISMIKQVIEILLRKSKNKE